MYIWLNTNYFYDLYGVDALDQEKIDCALVGWPVQGTFARAGNLCLRTAANEDFIDIFLI